MIYALIKDNTIKNEIIADETFIDVIKNNWDFIIRIDELNPRPKINDQYINGNFIIL